MAAGTQADGIIVPQRAVTVSPQGGTVMVVGAKNMAEPRKVPLGAMQGGNWVIQEGLRPGDRVIVSGLQKVQPGQPVRLAQTSSPDRKSVVSGKSVAVRVELG